MGMLRLKKATDPEAPFQSTERAYGVFGVARETYQASEFSAK
jgi:hypothetical protein